MPASESDAIPNIVIVDGLIALFLFSSITLSICYTAFRYNGISGSSMLLHFSIVEDNPLLCY
jgi:hypothetical protein